MPLNLDIYPRDFPRDATLTTEQTSVDALAARTRSMALTLQLNQRIAGLFSVSNQNATMRISRRRMPFDVVGVNPPRRTVHGTIGYFVGGQNAIPSYRGENGSKIEHMPFAGEWIAPIGSHLTDDRQWPACSGNKRAFWSVGGWSDDPGRLNGTIDRTTLIDENTVRIGSQLTAGGHGMVSCGNNEKGLVVGSFSAGWNGVNYGAGTRIHRISYTSPETVTRLGEELANPQTFCMQSVGNRSEILLIGGSYSATRYWNQQFSFQAVSLTTETRSLKGATLAASCQLGSAKFGNHDRVLIVGGQNLDGGWWGVSNKIVNGYRFSTDTSSTLGFQLDFPRSAVSGFSSNKNGYVGGGFTAGVGWPGSIRSLEKIFDLGGSESILTLGSELVFHHAELGGVSDYAAGHSS